MYRSCLHRPSVLVRVILVVALLVCSVAVFAQDLAPQEPVDAAVSATSPLPPPSAPVSVNQDSSAGPAPRLRIGPGDELEMTVFGVPDLTQHLRVSDAGQVSLALVGKVTIAGLTSDEAQALIEKKYIDGSYLKNPHVTLTVKDYTNQGITVIGEVQHPGTYSAMKARRLFEALMLAGGVTQRAGNSAVITHADPNAPRQMVEFSSDPVRSPEANVPLQPGDTVSVSRAGIVYVMGEVTRPGGFVITTADGKMTLMQALALASGPTRMASLGHTKLLRRTPKGLQSQDIDVAKILQAKAADMNLQTEDVVYVPASKSKVFASQSASSILSSVANLAVYRF